MSNQLSIFYMVCLALTIFSVFLDSAYNVLRVYVEYWGALVLLKCFVFGDYSALQWRYCL